MTAALRSARQGVRVAATVGISYKPLLALAAGSCLLPYTLRPEAALEDAAGVVWAGDGEGLVVHPAAHRAVPVLPHGAHQVGAGRQVLSRVSDQVRKMSDW